MNVEETLDDIEADLPKVETWFKSSPGSFVSYAGRGKRWSFIVLKYDLEGSGPTYYDGTASCGIAIVRLSARDLAKKAVTAAEEKLNGS